MSFEAQAWAIEQPVGGTKKIILIGIASHADRDGDNAWPAMETLARYANVDVRNIQRSISELEEAGYLFRSVRAGGTTRTVAHMRPNLYRLNMEGKPVPERRPTHRIAQPKDHPPAPASPPGASVTSPPGASVTSPPGASVTTPPAPAPPESSFNLPSNLSFTSGADAAAKKTKVGKTLIPENFEADGEGQQLASELGLRVDVEQAAFADHHAAYGTALANWQSGFRNWLRKAASMAQQRVSVRPSLAPQPAADVARATVPGTSVPDAALEQIKAERLLTGPPPEGERQRLKALQISLKAQRGNA